MQNQNLEKQFLPKGILRGGILFLHAEEAIELIEVTRNKNIKILGIDSFYITDKTTQPVMEHSIDFSSNKTSSGTWIEAQNFIKERKDMGFMFEVVINNL